MKYEVISPKVVRGVFSLEELSAWHAASDHEFFCYVLVEKVKEDFCIPQYKKYVSHVHYDGFYSISDKLMVPFCEMFSLPVIPIGWANTVTSWARGSKYSVANLVDRYLLEQGWDGYEETRQQLVDKFGYRQQLLKYLIRDGKDREIVIDFEVKEDFDFEFTVKGK